MIVKENKKSAIVTDDSEKIKKNKYRMSHTQNYKNDHKFLFITHLHDDKDEQFKKITFYFKLRFMYLKLYEMLNSFNSQQNLTTVTEELLSSAFHLIQSTYSLREDQV